MNHQVQHIKLCRLIEEDPDDEGCPLYTCQSASMSLGDNKRMIKPLRNGLQPPQASLPWGDLTCQEEIHPHILAIGNSSVADPE